MEQLSARHLMTLTLIVDFANVIEIGATPAGHRSIAAVTGGAFAGERLDGVVLGGHDWVIARADGLAIDVRLTLRTSDGAAIYLAYQGDFRAPPEVMARFLKGEQLAPEDYSLRAVARFECGAEHYRWLNGMIALAVGTQTLAGPIYELFETG